MRHPRIEEVRGGVASTGPGVAHTQNLAPEDLLVGVLANLCPAGVVGAHLGAASLARITSNGSAYLAWGSWRAQ